MSDAFLYATTVLIWGSTWLAIDYQLGIVQPEVSIVYRYVLATVVLFIYCKYQGFRVIFKVKNHLWFMLLGASLGIIGIVVLFAPQIDTASLTDSVFTGMALALAGTLVASLGNMVSQFVQSRQLPVVETNTWGMFYGALITAGVALASGDEFNFDASITYIGSLAYLAIFGSVVAFGAYLAGTTLVLLGNLLVLQKSACVAGRPGD